MLAVERDDLALQRHWNTRLQATILRPRRPRVNAGQGPFGILTSDTVLSQRIPRKEISPLSALTGRGRTCKERGRDGRAGGAAQGVQSYWSSRSYFCRLWQWSWCCSM